MGMETCCTLGLLNAEQAKQLKEAGLTAYNHNLDTSPERLDDVRNALKCPLKSNEAISYILL